MRGIGRQGEGKEGEEKKLCCRECRRKRGGRGNQILGKRKKLVDGAEPTRGSGKSGERVTPAVFQEKKASLKEGEDRRRPNTSGNLPATG